MALDKPIRKLLFTLTSAAFTVMSAFPLLLSARPPALIVQDNRTTSPAGLTEAEERDLRQLIPQTLSWIAIWRQPTTCLVSNQIQELDFAATYKKMPNQEIEMDLEIRQRSVEVSFDRLHVSLKFERLYNLGLAPADVNVFCENSYREYKADVARVSAQNPIQPNETRSGEQKKPEEVLNRLRQMHPSPPEDQIIGTESRRHTIKSEVPASTTTDNEEKRVLYGRILEEVRKEIALGCSRGQTNYVTIPDFNIGDPAVYVLINGPYFGGGDYIEWIDFRRDRSSGEYVAQHVKSFGLPAEVDAFVKLIKQKSAKRKTLSCSEE